MSQTTFLQKFIDFANVLKSFIGCTYLSMPFAFSRSGVVLGFIMVIVIALINDYTCVKIVKCKDLIIASLQEQFIKKQKSGILPGPEVELLNSGVLKKRLEDRITLGHIAKYGFGRKGQWVVMICLFISQFGFCTGYIIFIGSTLSDIQRYFSNLSPNNSSSHHIPNNSSSNTPDADQTVIMYMLLVPIPIFIVFSLLRTMRNIGLISISANFIIAYGYCSILGILIYGFVKDPGIVLAKYDTVSIMFGILTGAFEGIGTVIPIETSMVGNRHNFNIYLHVTIGIVIFVLSSFGIMGYLKYGYKTTEIILMTLPQTVYLTIVRFILVISVIGTYPLQQFPNIEIVEFLFFRKRSAEFEQDRKELLRSHESNVGMSEFEEAQREILHELSATAMNESNCLSINRANSNYQSAINSTDDDAMVLHSNGGEHLDSVYTKTQMRMLRILYDSEIEASAWKRNIVRLILVLLELGLAILMKDSYAYLSAYIGLLGGSFLAYIFPLAIEYKLTKYATDRLYLKLFNLFIVVIGTVGTISSLYFTTADFIKKMEGKK